MLEPPGQTIARERLSGIVSYADCPIWLYCEAFVAIRRLLRCRAKLSPPCGIPACRAPDRIVAACRPPRFDSAGRTDAHARCGARTSRPFWFWPRSRRPATDDVEMRGRPGVDPSPPPGVRRANGSTRSPRAALGLCRGPLLLRPGSRRAGARMVSRSSDGRGSRRGSASDSECVSASPAPPSGGR